MIFSAAGSTSEKMLFTGEFLFGTCIHMKCMRNVEKHPIKPPLNVL